MKAIAQCQRFERVQNKIGMTISPEKSAKGLKPFMKAIAQSNWDHISSIISSEVGLLLHTRELTVHLFPNLEPSEKSVGIYILHSIKSWVANEFLRRITNKSQRVFHNSSFC